MRTPGQTAKIDGTVLSLIRRVAAQEILPRFKNLREDEIHQKSPGEVVTEADLACERVLGRELRRLIPGSVVVGEESCHADPSLLTRLPTFPWAWVVDPLDGTRHFADGRDPFGVMVALVRFGRTDAAWIHMPRSGEDAHARRGQGAFLNGERVRFGPSPPLGELRGGLMTSFFPAPMRAQIERRRTTLRTEQGHSCAAQRDIDLLAGREHFALYYRTLPWDHLAGALLIEEAGGLARRLDGETFTPCDGRSGLLLTTDARSWIALQRLLVPSISVKDGLL